MEEQLQRIEEAEAQKLTAFSVSQADIDHELCRHGSGFANGKLRIYKFFEDMPSSDAAITFLKKEYSIGGHSHTYLNGESGFVDHDGKGIHFSNHDYKEKHTITWKAVARRLRELIALDRYLTEKEKAYLPEYEAKEAERRLPLAEEAAAREALRAAAAAMDERRKDAQYSFSLGDTVQLGATTYTILGYDEHTVMLSDPKYPLLSEDMARDVFERRLRENPANDHLIIETEPTASNEETESKTEIVMETVEVISAEENHLPYDVVIQTIRTEEREPVKPIEKTNFRITDDALGHGGPKAKFRMNMNAIRILQTIEFEQRLATPEEQEVLSRYVGWGSLPQAFEENNAAWADEFQELYETLSPEEYEAATINNLYDEFTAKYGLLNSRGNNMAFSDDSSYCLLCSLEVLDENGSLVRKADMFSKRTIRQQEAITSCDTATDALVLSLSEKAMIDMDYMAELTGKNEETLFSELKGVIFLNPLYGYGNNTERKYLTADEYLSGNVREKLAWARKSAEQNPDDYLVNMEALEKVQPVDLTASEIDVRLGATWLPQEDVQRFMVELLKPAYYASSKIKVHYSPLTAEWNISNKNSDYGNVTANVTYGTKRINGYKIIEETLNLKDVRIFDTVQDEYGNDKRLLNKKETVLAQQKQQLIKDASRAKGGVA